jgi:hypothetical protein
MSVRILFMLAALLSANSVALAQSGTTAEQAACRPDVRRLCHEVQQGAGPNAYLQCLQEHRDRLSERCRAVLESHGV